MSTLLKLLEGLAGLALAGIVIGALLGFGAFGWILSIALGALACVAIALGLLTFGAWSVFLDDDNDKKP